jgi:drug/metabolite transporter (DMT)-like permease
MRREEEGGVDLHRTSGRRGLGLALAFLTMSLWGALPLALKGVLRQMDAVTITWYRFTLSTLLLVAFLGWRRRLPPLRTLGRSTWGLLAVATVFLAANYYGYIVGLDFTTAADAQVLIQLAPLLLALGGIFVFDEHFTPLQWLGLGVLVVGLGLFFGAQLDALVDASDRYLRGAAVMVFAAVSWAVYGLAQKQLLRSLSSQGVMLCIYAGCVLIFLPLSAPAGVAALDGTGLALLGFCAVNTALAYGAFAESLQHWEASRVSAVLALTPLATLAFGEAAHAWWPGLDVGGPLPTASVLGAVVVVAGSLITSLGGRNAVSG